MGKKKLRHPTPFTRFLSSFQAIQFLDIQLADGEGTKFYLLFYYFIYLFDFDKNNMIFSIII